MPNDVIGPPDKRWRPAKCEIARPYGSDPGDWPDDEPYDLCDEIAGVVPAELRSGELSYGYQKWLDEHGCTDEYLVEYVRADAPDDDFSWKVEMLFAGKLKPHVAKKVREELASRLKRSR